MSGTATVAAVLAGAYAVVALLAFLRREPPSPVLAVLAALPALGWWAHHTPVSALLAVVYVGYIAAFWPPALEVRVDRRSRW